MAGTSWSVHTCDICGAQFRYRNISWENPDPEALPRILHGDVYDRNTDRAQRLHATKHGGSLDKQFAYTGPTTWTVTTEYDEG